MRIALVAPDCNKSDGQARYVSELAERLATRHRVDVWSVGFDDTDPALVRHRPIRAPSTRTRARFALFLYRASRALRSERYDVVHALGASCTQADVVTFQFCQAAWDRELSRDRSIAPSERGTLRASSRWVIAAAESRIARRARALIAVSRRTADEVRISYRTTLPTVIPNGVDLERFQPSDDHRSEVREELGVATTTPLAMFLGEFARKNLDTAITALAASRGGFVLAAIGGSDAGPHRDLATSLGIGDRLRFVTKTKSPERYLAAADAFVFPTIYEPFGMAPLEAAASGVPVVVSATCGFAEWIEDGVDGLIVQDPRDAVSFARALDRLTPGGELPCRLRREGRRLAERFHWSDIVARTEAVYASLKGRER